MSDRCEIKPIIALGLGSHAFGREHRAVRVFERIKEEVLPLFLLPKWGDGSVPRLIESRGLPYRLVPSGYLGRARLDWSAITIAYSPVLTYRILSAYRQHNAKGAVLFSIHPLLNAPAAIFTLRYLLGADIVFYLGDIPSNHFVHRKVARAINLLSRVVIVNSHAVARGLMRLGVVSERLVVVHNGIDVDTFQDVRPMDLVPRFGDGARFIVGFVGQINSEKGVEDFLTCAERVSDQRDDVRFVIAGSADAVPAFAERLKWRVRQGRLENRLVFLGRVNEMPALYAALDLLVVPSRHEEPLANVVLEGMASGLPVVGTRSGGIPEIIQDGVTGFIVNKSSPIEIADRVLQLLENKTDRIAMGQAGRLRVAESFDIRTTARRVKGLLLNG